MKNKEDRLVAGEFLYSVAFFYSTHLDLDLIISLCLEVCNSYLYLYRVIIFTCKCSDFLNYFIKIIFYSYLDPIMLQSVFKNRTYSKLNNLVCPLRYHVPLYPTSLIYWSVESFNPYLFTVFFYCFLYNLQYFFHSAYILEITCKSTQQAFSAFTVTSSTHRVFRN